MVTTTYKSLSYVYLGVAVDRRAGTGGRAMRSGADRRGRCRKVGAGGGEARPGAARSTADRRARGKESGPGVGRPSRQRGGMVGGGEAGPGTEWQPAVALVHREMTAAWEKRNEASGQKCTARGS